MRKKYEEPVNQGAVYNLPLGARWGLACKIVAPDNIHVHSSIGALIPAIFQSELSFKEKVLDYIVDEDQQKDAKFGAGRDAVKENSVETDVLLLDFRSRLLF